MDETNRIQMAKAIQIAARKDDLKNKESASETFRSVKEEKELKINRGVKRAVKQMIKEK